MKLKNFFGHLHTVNKHRFIVFKLSIRAGIPIRGLLHDLSKYSPIEFFEGVKYYSGKRSPISCCKEVNGYSKAWLHHKGRNKHHFEYWLDPLAPNKTPVIPYKYAVEMICDTLSASLVYNGKQWYPSKPLEYFNNRKDKKYINEDLQRFLETVYKQVSEQSIDSVIKKKNLKFIYNQCVLHKYIKFCKKKLIKN